VLRQTLAPTELIIVVDGPIAKELDDALIAATNKTQVPVVVKALAKNSGLWNARNVGLSACTNDEVALHDADDLMHPERLRIQAEVFKAENLAVLGSPVLEFDIFNSQIVGMRRTPVQTPLKHSDFWLRNPIHHSSVMISRSAIAEVGQYRNLPGVEDLDLWRRLARRGAPIRNDTRIVQILGTSEELLHRRRSSRVMLRSEFHLAKDSLVTPERFRRIKATSALGIRCSYRLAPVPMMHLAQRRFLRAAQPYPLENVAKFMAAAPMNVDNSRQESS